MNESLDLYTGRPVTIPGFPSFLLAVRGAGNPDLREESLTAWEIGYIGTLSQPHDARRQPVPQRHEGQHQLHEPAGELGPVDAREHRRLPRAGLPAAAGVLTALAAAGIYLPRTGAMYSNLGPIRQRGVEAFVEHRFADGLSGYANYSWLDEPEPLPSPTPSPLARSPCLRATA